jgi:exonuclease VII small subunit
MLYCKGKQRGSDNMPTQEYKEAKEKWLSIKAKYDESVRLLEAITNLLEHHQRELNEAFSLFSVQQAVRIQKLKQANVKEVSQDE